MIERGRDLATIKASLAAALAAERTHYFGAVRAEWARYAEEYFWEESQQQFRIDDLLRYELPPGTVVLDLAAGCGQFMLKALQSGYDAWGVEPEAWKVELIHRKWVAQGQPEQWLDRVVRAFGEQLPFPDNFFGAVSSYQTLEHVQDPDAVLAEMLRVVRPGGGIYLRCPDYRSTYEGHYQLPWLPLFPRPAAKVYLRLMGRPTAGLDTIRYVTQTRIAAALRSISADRGWRIDIVDDDHRLFKEAMQRRHIPVFPGAYGLYRARRLWREAFRVERGVNLFIRVVAK